MSFIPLHLQRFFSFFCFPLHVLHVRLMSCCCCFFLFFFFLLLLLFLFLLVGPLYIWISFSLTGSYLPFKDPRRFVTRSWRLGFPETGCLVCASLKLSPVSVKQKRVLVRLRWRCDMKRVELRLLVQLLKRDPDRVDKMTLTCSS